MEEPQITPTDAWNILRRLGQVQRRLICVILVIIALNVLVALLALVAGWPEDVLDLVAAGFGIVLFGLKIYTAVLTYRAGKAIGSRFAILWGLGAMLPQIIGLLFWLNAIARATKELKQAGIKVGLLGATVAENPPEDWAMYVPKGHLRRLKKAAKAQGSTEE